MRFIFLLVMTLVAAFAADPQAIQMKVNALVRAADQAASSSRNSEAEEGYKTAIVQCGLLPPDKYHCKTDVLWKLARFYEHFKEYTKMEVAYKERLEILSSKQKAASRPDLDLGIALFDLQSALEGLSLQDASREAEGFAYMEQAKAFYEKCKIGFPDMRGVCDRRLADVEGMHGSILTVKKRFEEAAPFLKAVIDRPDSGVRTEILVAALKGHATALIVQGKSAEAQEFIQRAQRLEAPQR